MTKEITERPLAYEPVKVSDLEGDIVTHEDIQFALKLKSLVKTVDPDNLPKGKIFLDDCLLIGHLSWTSEGLLFSGNWGNIEIYDIENLKYILESDLIEVFNNAK